VIIRWDLRRGLPRAWRTHLERSARRSVARYLGLAAALVLPDNPDAGVTSTALPIGTDSASPRSEARCPSTPFTGIEQVVHRHATKHTA
jgi:hypothetical protein